MELRQASGDFATSPRPDPGEISRSWQRCRQAGLTPELKGGDGPHIAHGELRNATSRCTQLIAQARPVMEFIYAQIKDSGCVMLLSDENGVLLEAAGDTDFCARAAQVALQPGACWAEDARGTNAVGTALVEARPVVVNGAEHYLRRNSFLACAAAPLVEPSGKLIGVIDISCDSRRYHPHTFGLVRTAAQMIENHIFEASFAGQMKLRFHTSGAGLGSMLEAAVALREDGRVLGANRAGFNLLGLRPSDIGQRQMSECFGLSMRELADLDRQAQGRPMLLHPARGQTLFATLQQLRPSPVPGFTAPEPAARKPATTLRAQTDAMISAAITEAGGNIAAAARSLGISRNTMYRRLGHRAN
jgi:transcriptional regulator of acetoin/glycerol metabolism